MRAGLELDGVEVEGYDDFGEFRDLIARLLEGGTWASPFPVLMNHPDSHRDWGPAEASQLQRELTVIRTELVAIPASAYPDGWQARAARQVGHQPGNYSTYFIDVDGKLLRDRLIDHGPGAFTLVAEPAARSSCVSLAAGPECHGISELIRPNTRISR